MGGAVQSVFGGSGSQTQNSQTSGYSGTNFSPEDLANIRNAQGNFAGQTGAYQQSANAAAGQGFQNVGNINTNFQAQPGGLDAFGQQQVAQQLGMNQAAQQTQQNQIAQQFQNNPGLANILSAQSKGQNQLANNTLGMDALSSQLGRQQNAQLLGNQANLQQLGGLGQALGLQGQGLGAQQNLLQQNLGIGQALGQQYQGSQTASVNTNQQNGLAQQFGQMGKSVTTNPGSWATPGIHSIPTGQGSAGSPGASK